MCVRACVCVCVRACVCVCVFSLSTPSVSRLQHLVSGTTFYQSVPKLAVAVKYSEVKYTPLKGGVLNFGTSRYVNIYFGKHCFEIFLHPHRFLSGWCEVIVFKVCLSGRALLFDLIPFNLYFLVFT